MSLESTLMCIPEEKWRKQPKRREGTQEPEAQELRTPQARVEDQAPLMLIENRWRQDGRWDRGNWQEWLVPKQEAKSRDRIWLGMRIERQNHKWARRQRRDKALHWCTRGGSGWIRVRILENLVLKLASPLWNSKFQTETECLRCFFFGMRREEEAVEWRSGEEVCGVMHGAVFMTRGELGR